MLYKYKIVALHFKLGATDSAEIAVATERHTENQEKEAGILPTRNAQKIPIMCLAVVT